MSRKESPGVVSFWNQTPLAACCGAGFDPKAGRPRSCARVASSRDSSGGSPNSSRRARILRDQTVVLERPGPSEVQPRLEIRCQDPAEPQPHADLAGPDCEEAAPEPEDRRAGGGCEPKTTRGNDDSGQLRGSVAEPDPFVWNVRPAHAEDQQAGEQHGASFLDEVRHESGGRPECRAWVEPPGVVNRIEGETRGERHDDDRGQIGSHCVAAQNLQQHDEAADVRGRPGEKENENGAWAQAFESQRGRHGRRAGSASVKRDAQDEHQHHRGDSAAPHPVKQLRWNCDDGDSGQNDTQNEPPAHVVEQLDEAVTDDAPCRINYGPAGATVRQRIRPMDMVVVVIVLVRVIMSFGVACVLTSLIACGRSLGDL